MGHKQHQAQETETLSPKAEAALRALRPYEPDNSASDAAYALRNGEQEAILAHDRKRVLRYCEEADRAFADNDIPMLCRAVRNVQTILSGAHYAFDAEQVEPWREDGDFAPLSYGDAFRIFQMYVGSYSDDPNPTVALLACGELAASIYVFFDCEV